MGHEPHMSQRLHGHGHGHGTPAMSMGPPPSERSNGNSPAPNLGKGREHANMDGSGNVSTGPGPGVRGGIGPGFGGLSQAAQDYLLSVYFTHIHVSVAATIKKKKSN